MFSYLYYFHFRHEGKTHAFTQILVTESCIPHLFRFQNCFSPFFNFWVKRKHDSGTVLTSHKFTFQTHKSHHLTSKCTRVPVCRGQTSTGLEICRGRKFKINLALQKKSKRIFFSTIGINFSFLSLSVSFRKKPLEGTPFLLPKFTI